MSPEQPYEKAAEETARAVQKVAGVAEKSIDVANSVGGFLKKVLGNGFEELGGAFSDWAQVYRYEQAVKLADRVTRIHQKRGIEGKTISIPPRLGIPLLLQSTLEDNDILLDMWAGLIANVTDPNTKIEARRSFCGLLSSLEPLDALVLTEIYRWKERHPERLGLTGDPEDDKKARLQWPNLKRLAADLDKSEVMMALSLENMERLALVFDFMPNLVVELQEELTETEESTALKPITGMAVPVTHDHAMIDLTHTGLALIEACRG